MHVCVYCASSSQIDQAFIEAARATGSGLAARGWPLVYGGGSVGLMGEVARHVHAGNGTVVGVIPQALLDLEVGYLDCDELLVTTTMRERKAIMEARADAFVTLAGGFGTLEELLEEITLKQLRYHAKPLVIVNTNGFFDPLLAQFEQIFRAGFANKTFTDNSDIVRESSRLYHVVGTVEEAFRYLEATQAAA